MRKAGIKVRTFMGAGRYIHKVTYVGSIKESELIPDEVVRAHEKLNEALYDSMPVGSRDLVVESSYKVPCPSLATRLISHFRSSESLE